MSESVCAVVVTYNRKNLLRTCLRTLIEQTRPIDFILIVDNASTDGTPQMLREEFPQLFLLELGQNSGGAGGFHAGMKLAYEKGFDWVWVMDDDVRALPNALETMLGYAAVGDLIQARKVESGKMLIWEAIWDVNACYPVNFTSDTSFTNGKKWTNIVCANFEGALMKRMVIEKVGLPDVRYFIAGDDSVYGFLASRHVNAIYIDFVAMQKDVDLSKPRNRFYYYFPLRNRFLTYEHFLKAGIPVRRKMFLLNSVAGALTLWIDILKTPRERKFGNVKTVFQALTDGYQGRFGKPSWL